MHNRCEYDWEAWKASGAEICIAGAGLIGSLIGWRLARQGYRVHLFEASEEEPLAPATPRAAAHTAAAMVAPYSELPLCSPNLFRMGLQSLELWPTLLQALSADTGETIDFCRGGTLMVAHPADNGLLDDMGRCLARHHVGAEQGIAWQNRQQIEALEPHLSEQFRRGLWLMPEGHLENRRLLVLLHRAIISAGGKISLNSPVDYVAEDAHSHWYVNQQAYPAVLWIDCCGVGAQRWRSQVRGVRGEVIWIEAPDVEIQRPVRLLHPKYHLYLVPKEQGRYILGATEIESSDRSPVSVRSALEMLSALYALSPALAEARILELASNLRPALSHHEPEITRSAGTLAVNGLYRHGFLLSPALLDRLQQEYQVPLGLMPLAAASRQTSATAEAAV
ncbi:MULTISPECIES: FAD-dependent oxidoreductase [unclassified Oceanobacter]|uniref:FAD-dependent oxidoreductase n=2 Tax=Gammaproteobacteria TaxID=1236 RepID=UPI0027330506|nr:MULTISPECIES: FAD-dependent oxidoreductase [unclassified Oceanobacter]MDP2506695.1 FAD-dependent oxidoreductase [Oceanobacter sp. 3_MG-2023]MDP2548750.1 FAD-dependent oxidoreductase [Oceanobacter sp. 4_MG-2023]MDP2609299.1 FAD-dependent oxidoreductase [Oceanobacter sp. 1_MG-2023]MDP2612604.1 FAD-dependent oxidoreductase [Oceanobacter sp. 2_MG-2023]